MKDSSHQPFDLKPVTGAASPRNAESLETVGAECRPGKFPEHPAIVASTARYVVISKPSGMLSVPGKGLEKADCAAARVRLMFPGSTGPLVVHRLDMETSGLLVFGLDEEAQKDLSSQFERRVVEKAYTALVVGSPVAGWSGPDPLDHEEGEISLPMRGDLERRPLQVIDVQNGREAVTRWRVLARETDRIRIRFRPLTGRTHQLRVHAASGLGHPIIGDELYGGPEAERLMLHASELSFLEPGTRRRVEFACGAEF